MTWPAWLDAPTDRTDRYLSTLGPLADALVRDALGQAEARLRCAITDQERQLWQTRRDAARITYVRVRLLVANRPPLDSYRP